MAAVSRLLSLVAFAAVVSASGCPFGHTSAQTESEDALQRRAPPIGADYILKGDVVNDADTWMTSDVGGPIEDQNSLTAGERGPTLLEDFIFRQKITHFDHERVPERAVHARGAG